MKIECLGCRNNDPDKFSHTKTGIICLLCLGKKIKETAENQKELAQLEIKTQLSRQTGGNNRRFTRAYLAMKNHLSFLENLPGRSEDQENFISGFRQAIVVFEQESK